MERSDDKEGQEDSPIPIPEWAWQGSKAQFRPDGIITGVKGPADIGGSDATRTICDHILMISSISIFFVEIHFS
jgi:hypothetical protein